MPALGQNPSEGHRLTAEEYLKANYETGDHLAVLLHHRAKGDTIQRVNTAGAIASAKWQAWVYLLHFYASVISDCPLFIASQNAAAGIRSVTVKVELANQPSHDQMVFKVIWEILDNNGLSGSIEIYNSFALIPEV